MLVVVVALALLDVVGEGLGHPGALAVALDDVRDVIADHAPEPPHLIARVLYVISDVRRRCNADVDVIGIAPGGSGGVAHCLDRPRRDLRVGQLQDEAIANLAGEGENLGAVRRDEDPGA